MHAALIRLLASLVDRRLAAIPRPTDAPAGHSTGVDPDRILVLGSGPASGWGVRSNDLALPGQLARELSRRTLRGTDVDLMTERQMTVADCVEAIAPVDLQGYDAIVVTLGIVDAMRHTSRSAWRHSMDALIVELTQKTGPTTRVLIAGIESIRTMPVYLWRGRIADRRARQLNDITRSLVAERLDVGFLELPAEYIPQRQNGAPGMYQHWAELIAVDLAPSLDVSAAVGAGSADSARAYRGRAQSEGPRQEALDDLQIVGRTPSSPVQRIVHMAQEMFGTHAAAVTLIDHDRQWMYAKAGTDIEEVPRSESFCAVTISSGRSLVVPDARRDSRFRDLGAVTSEEIGFYAGYPIESPDGHRIGALCVVDPTPREFDCKDRSTLRDLALLVQQELWASSAGSEPHPASGAPDVRLPRDGIQTSPALVDGS